MWHCSFECQKACPLAVKTRSSPRFFSNNPNVNWLSFARVFLFGARYFWFVVGIPIYFYAVLSDRSEAGNQQAFFITGSFMALWVILYGFVQATAPRLLKATGRDTQNLIGSARYWVAMMIGIPLVLALATALTPEPAQWLTALLIFGLLLFGAIFAINSSLHSYLILAFTSGERVTLDVGFYYMANAAGRLLGTDLSGVSYQVGGVPLCLGCAGILLALMFSASPGCALIPHRHKR